MTAADVRRVIEEALQQTRARPQVVTDRGSQFTGGGVQGAGAPVWTTSAVACSQPSPRPPCVRLSVGV